MNRILTLGSLFDGSGTFPMAGILSGITPVWASEIEPFPIAVTQKRLPFMKHYGNISKLNGTELPPVDIITFGSPCQDMSVAGKRVGLEGSRSSLFHEAIRIIKEMRCATNGKYPRFAVWENVAGAFSSNNGEDFQCVLEEFCKVKDAAVSLPKPKKWEKSGEIVGDDYSIAYRTFDSQYWGVPQRRVRIYLVADFAGQCAGKILFESEGVSGYSAEGFRAWQRAAGGAADCVGEAGELCLNDQGGNRMDVTEDMTCTLRAEAHHPPCVLSAGFCTEHSAKARGIGYEEEKSPTLRAGVVPATIAIDNHPADSRVSISSNGNVQTLTSRCGTGGGNVPMLLEYPKAYGISAFESNAMKSDNPHSGVYEAETSRTIDTSGSSPACHQGGVAIVESYALQGSMIGRADKNGPQGNGINEDVSFTLNTCDKHAVVYAIDRESYNCGQNFARNMGISENGVSSTLNAQGPSAVATPVYTSSKASFFTNAQADTANTLVATDYKDPPLINDVGYTVRRLTPQECALLQGMPTWWCEGIGIENPTEEDMTFWRDVFETHRLAVSPDKKPKTDKQIQKWLKNPHSDSAEYRMWGNGLSLPTAWFVLAGIAYYAHKNQSE